jgi:hypothetical protein
MRGVNDTAPNGYEAMLARWSDSLAAGRADHSLLSEVTSGDATDVERFTLNTIEERRRMLAEELAMVALACNDFDELARRYIRATPRVAFNLDEGDPQRFLRWLKAAKELSPRERDFVAYQEAEYACLALARQRRAEHVSFQQLLAASRSSQIDAPRAEAIIFLNPIRVESRLAALDSPHGSNAVIFFPVGTQIRFNALVPPSADWLETLAAAAPCSLNAWTARCPNAGAGAVASFARELSAAGLVAIGDEKVM